MSKFAYLSCGSVSSVGSSSSYPVESGISLVMALDVEDFGCTVCDGQKMILTLELQNPIPITTCNIW